MRRILCMFLVWVMFFTEMDFTVMAAEATNVFESGMDTSETAETIEQVIADQQDSDMADKEDILDETSDATSEETGIEESEKTDEQDKPEKEEESKNEDIDKESEVSNEEEEAEKTEEDLEAGDGQEEIDAEESVELEEVELPEDENDQEENITQFGLDEIEVYAVKSSDSVNSAVKEWIYLFKSIYPEGSVWSASYDKGKQCFGFAMLIADKVFGCHPKNTSIRTASNGTVSNGWTCYYVNANNCNSLAVEPGDIIDSPTQATSSHTAMVVSVSGSNITCVQCNLSGNCKVYWTQNFNYNSQNASMAQIYSRFGGYGTIRLWKPNESMKNAIVGSAPVADTEAPRVGAVTVSNSKSVLTYSCTAMDNIGITKAWLLLLVLKAKGMKQQFLGIRLAVNGH